MHLVLLALCYQNQWCCCSFFTCVHSKSDLDLDLFSIFFFFLWLPFDHLELETSLDSPYEKRLSFRLIGIYIEQLLQAPISLLNSYWNLYSTVIRITHASLQETSCICLLNELLVPVPVEDSQIFWECPLLDFLEFSFSAVAEFVGGACLHPFTYM